jgi:glycosyltransferase involved in cell wall biosynthesis
VYASKLPISVCIPVKNEEAAIGGCLDSLDGAFDDVAVIDSASSDETAEIARRWGAKVYQFDWNGRFPKKRNWALRNVPFRHDWILFLDADERLTPAVLDAMATAIIDTSHAGFWLAYTNIFMGRVLRHGDVLRKLAFFRRDAGEYEAFPEQLWSNLDMEVHEHPVLQGSTGVISPRIIHDDDRGLHHYLAKHNEYSTWEANRYLWLSTASAQNWHQLSRRQQIKYRHLAKWWLADLYFFTTYVAKGGFLDGISGWRFARLKRRYFQDIRLKIIDGREAKTQPPRPAQPAG